MAGNETDAISEAYLSRVQTLYLGLVTNLGDGRAETESVQAFTKGLNLAKRAKELALGALGPGPSTAARRTTRSARGSR